jgi:hypothetical protein
MANWLGEKPTHPAGHCQFCGYNLYSLQGETCPECGNSRLAWVEAPCEECGEISVFPVEEVEWVKPCQFCGKAVDVARPAGSSRQLGCSIRKTRLNYLAFAFMVFVITPVTLLPFLGSFLLVSFLVTGSRPSVVVLLLALCGALVTAVWIGLKTCYR